MATDQQNAMSAAALDQWDVPVSVPFISSEQDWQARQKTQYAAILGLLKDDFLGLKDWQTQIQTYSLANPAILSGPMAAIKALVGKNHELMTELTDDGQLGLVGSYLTQMNGFADIVLNPEEILDSQTLDDSLDI